MRMSSGRTAAEAVIFALLFVTALRGVVSAKSRDLPNYKTFEYFVYEKIAPPDATVAVVAGQDNNLSFMGFGQTTVYDNIIKEVQSDRAPAVGMARAIGVATKLPLVSNVFLTHSFNSTILGVGSIEIGGILDFQLPLRPSELTVTGGSGDFKFMRGIIVIDLIYFQYPHNTYKATVTLLGC